MALQGSRYALAYGLIAVVIIAAVVALVLHGSSPAPEAAQNAATSTQAIAATFACNEGKTIEATFHNPQNATSTVDLKLSDGRIMTLPQTISADGARYSDGDPQVQGSESFVFWNKGNTALVLEHNTDKTYIGCIELKPDTTGQLAKWYSDGSRGFSIRYPEGYAVDPHYTFQELGPGKSISGVKFTIPESLATGTNLSDDAYIAVESLPRMQECTASRFLDGAPESQTVTDGDTTYSVASSTGAAAGNRYEETVYAIPGTNPCIAVRYFIHYGVIDNYPPGTVQEFDKAALLSQFDAIRRSLTIGQ